MAYGGQIAVPLDIAQRFAEHCTGAPATWTQEGLAPGPPSLAGPGTPHAHQPLPQAQASLPHDVIRMHSNPLAEDSEPLSPSLPGAGSVPALIRRVSRLSTLSANDPRWLQAVLGSNSSCFPGAAESTPSALGPLRQSNRDVAVLLSPGCNLTRAVQQATDQRHMVAMACIPRSAVAEARICPVDGFQAAVQRLPALQ